MPEEEEEEEEKEEDDDSAVGSRGCTLLDENFACSLDYNTVRDARRQRVRVQPQVMGCQGGHVGL